MNHLARYRRRQMAQCRPTDAGILGPPDVPHEVYFCCGRLTGTPHHPDCDGFKVPLPDVPAIESARVRWGTGDILTGRTKNMTETENDPTLVVLHLRDNREVPLTVPVVHLNGTARGALVEERSLAAGALRNALNQLAAASPNARDYYPVPGAFERACRQHDGRIALVKRVLDEVEAEADYLLSGEE
jgi:hypothetical protein